MISMMNVVVSMMNVDDQYDECRGQYDECGWSRRRKSVDGHPLLAM